MARGFLFLASLAALAACKGSAAPSGPTLPSADFADSGVPFDKDEVVPSAAFSDFNALAASDIQTFLERDPYGSESFLQTYQSNGVLFSAAVAHAAVTYRLNPIVLLVAVEEVGGLIGDVNYPQPFASVDYLFGCGCSVPSSPSTCDPAAAGLDVQLDCYANALRASLDGIAMNGVTSGGFGPGKSATTLDGITVTPKDDSTAALYQYDPVVGAGQSGSSLFANIWLEYTNAFSYGIPMEANPGAVAQVGDPCIAASDCAVDNAICATMNYPGGLCTAKCSGTCSGADTFCAAFSTGGFCLSLCSPTDPWSCRTGYACTLVQPSGAPAGTPSQYVCDAK